MESTTQYLAVWGALTGTFVLIWDITKWLKTGPKLKIRVRPNTWYDDGEILSVEKTEHGEIINHALYYHIEVINIGNLPTTLIDIKATTKLYGAKKFIKQIVGHYSCDSKAFTPLHGNSLPQIIGPGEIWSCRINKEYGCQVLHCNISRPDKYPDA